MEIDPKHSSVERQAAIHIRSGVIAGNATAPRMESAMDFVRDWIRITLVQMYDNLENLADPFRAGGRTTVEEASVRLLGEDFDTYEEATRAQIRDCAVEKLAGEIEEAMQEGVRAGRYELIIEADGKRLYKSVKA